LFLNKLRPNQCGSGYTYIFIPFSSFLKKINDLRQKTPWFNKKAFIC